MAVVDTLAQLVAFPTISEKPVTEIAAYMATRAEDLGWCVEIFEDDEMAGKANVVCTAGPIEAAGGVVISGHMDVVPVAGQPWDSDPFQLKEEDGRLIARGSADMKGFLACTLEALGRINAADLTRPVVLIWTHDEEVGCLGSARLVKTLKALDRPLPTEALIGEPTDFKILRMHNGHVGLRICTHGASAHSSMPDLGASAIKAMGRVLALVESIEISLGKEKRLEAFLERPFVTLNAGEIRGGSAINLVPDFCEITLGYRPLPGDDPLAVARLLEERLADLNLGECTASLEVLRVTPALLSPENLALQSELLPHACDPQTGAAPFATDGGNLAALGIDSLIFGPGSIEVAHKANEYVPSAALHKGVDVVESLLRSRSRP
jgi:acetylornithine deacetylase